MWHVNCHWSFLLGKSLTHSIVWWLCCTFFTALDLVHEACANWCWWGFVTWGNTRFPYLSREPPSIFACQELLHQELHIWEQLNIWPLSGEHEWPVWGFRVRLPKQSVATISSSSLGWTLLCPDFHVPFVITDLQTDTSNCTHWPHQTFHNWTPFAWSFTMQLL
jgi:hypothetical protein